ncbi:LacI family DNA-binding transcriptional regulator [Rhodocytophaga aerolata]|uniref:LacI family DNA-binding transcriptional regulator n=1 Tax=Rhodocytophaga aerolata TaxID=455078 RepID=A0ABT8RBC0_9BACT|nr:LacI family DNA-binding transcriptional regulator [Rhodocytophaga aerolata]MDO1449377.1 LacI family DNA-binding transcriptional regulator [Rhodocytophaga aerolata]
MPRLDPSRRTTVTIYDIAKKLSISASTVSRALRNHPDIRPETVEAVKDMAKKLNYQPNTIAQSLRERRTKLLGVIVPEIQQHLYGSVLNGIEEVAFRKGYQVLVSKSGESYERELMQTYALSNQVDGVIACLSQHTHKIDHFRQLKNQGLPLVFFDRAPERLAAHRVLFDNEAGSFALTENLIRSGFTRIAYLSGPEQLAVCQERLSGYQKALERYNLPFDQDLVIHTGFGYQDGRIGFTRLMKLENRPDAIFAASDQIATAVVVEARRIDLEIPHHLGLVAFGSDPVHALLHPAITGLHPKGYEMGSTAAQLCIQEIEQAGKNKRFRTERLTTEIIIRHSSIKASGEDSVVSAYSRFHKRDGFGDEVIYMY